VRTLSLAESVRCHFGNVPRGTFRKLHKCSTWNISVLSPQVYAACRGFAARRRVRLANGRRLGGGAGVELFGVLTGRKLFLAVLGFSTLQVRLTTVCSCCGIGSRLQVGLLEEVAPALVAVF